MGVLSIEKQARWHVADAVIESLVHEHSYRRQLATLTKDGFQGMEAECAQILSTKKQASTAQKNESTTPKKRIRPRKDGQPSAAESSPAPPPAAQNSVTAIIETPEPTLSTTSPSLPAPEVPRIVEGTKSAPHILTPRKRTSVPASKDITSFFSTSPLKKDLFGNEPSSSSVSSASVSSAAQEVMDLDP